MNEKEFRAMMNDLDVPLSRKLWYLNALLKNNDVKGVVTILPSFLNSVEDLLFSIDPETEIKP